MFHNLLLMLPRIIFLPLLFLFSIASPAQLVVREACPNLRFTAPVEIQAATDGSGRLFVVEQPGRIRIWSGDSLATRADTLLDITGRVRYGGERGLLGLALHPRFAENGYFFVNYTRQLAGLPLETVVARYKVSNADTGKADPNSEVIFLTYAQPFDNHNGGKIAFGPDGYLYISSGDGGSGGDPRDNGQTLSSLLGKILRIDVNNADDGLAYAIPADNPFKNNTTGIRKEIYAYGLRNVWKFSFDPPTKRLWAADVGQNAIEEVDTIISGGNYGWRLKEGSACYNPSSSCEREGLINPIWQYTHASGDGVSITGGLVYRGRQLPTLEGKYVYGDFGSGKLWSLDLLSGGRVNNQLLLNNVGQIAAFGTDVSGDQLFICHYAGRILKLIDASIPSSLPQQDFILSNVQVFPNPASGFAVWRWQSRQAGSVQLEILDQQGKQLFRQKSQIGTGSVNWPQDLKMLRPGIYIYRLTQQGQSATGKIVVK